MKTHPDSNEGMLLPERFIPMPDTISPLEGRVAIVTGASAGIGRAYALALAAAGATVVAAARRLGDKNTDSSQANTVADAPLCKWYNLQQPVAVQQCC